MGILFFLMAIAFMGYVLPFGQMSFWGATVITNLLSPFPSLVEWVCGGYCVHSPTLKRFFLFHFQFLSGQYAMLKAVPNKNAGFIILLTSIFTFFFFGEIRNLTTLCLLNNNGF